MDRGWLVAVEVDGKHTQPGLRGASRIKPHTQCPISPNTSPYSASTLHGISPQPPAYLPLHSTSHNQPLHSPHSATLTQPQAPQKRHTLQVYAHSASDSAPHTQPQLKPGSTSTQPLLSPHSQAPLKHQVLQVQPPKGQEQLVATKVGAVFLVCGQPLQPLQEGGQGEARHTGVGGEGCQHVWGAWWGRGVGRWGGRVGWVGGVRG